MLVHACREFRSGSGHGQRTQGASGGIQACVERGKRRGQDYDLDHVAGMRNANAGEERDERRFVGGVGGIRQHECHEHHGTHVEHEDADDHRIEGLRQHFLGVLGFAGGHTDHFGAAEREYDAQSQGEYRCDAHREQASVIGDVGDAGVGVANRGARYDGPDGDEHERDDGGHLDGREPEFRLTEHFHAQHVQHEHQRQRNQCQ